MESAVPNPVATSIKTALGLALVIGLIYIVCLILKKIQENKMRTYGGPIMELVSTINLGVGPGKSVHVVRIADRFLVIGATSAKITLLTEIDKDSLSNQGQGHKFDELLAAYTQKFVRRGDISGRLEGNNDER